MNTNFDGTPAQNQLGETQVGDSDFVSSASLAGKHFDVELFDQLWESLFYEITEEGEWRQDVVELSKDEENAVDLFGQMFQELAESPVLTLEALDNFPRKNQCGEPMEEYFAKFSHLHSLIEGEIAIREVEDGTERRTDIVLKTVLNMEHIEHRLFDGEGPFDELNINVSLIGRVRTLALKEGWSCFTSEEDGYSNYKVGLCFQLTGAAPHQIRDAVSLFERAVGDTNMSAAPSSD